MYVFWYLVLKEMFPECELCFSGIYDRQNMTDIYTSDIIGLLSYN